MKLILNPLFWLMAFLSLNSFAAEEKPDDEPNPRAEYIRGHYQKFEYQIPMRDGTKLFTTVYSPIKPSQKYPIILQRTPYSAGPYGADQYKERLGPTAAFEKDGLFLPFKMFAASICQKVHSLICALKTPINVVVMR